MRHIGPRPLFIALLPLLLVALLLNALSQALPRLYTAAPTFLATPQNQSPPADAAAYLSTHPPTHVGFWKQCTGSAPCTDLQLACGADAQQPVGDITALQNTPLAAAADEFTRKQTQLCPRVNAARVLMALSLFAGAVAVFAVAVRLAGLMSGGAVAGLFAVLAASLMAIMHLTALALLASVKNILDTLAMLTRALHPETHTSTALPTVTTQYALSLSFYVLIAAAAVSCALLPLAIVLAVHPASRRASYPPLGGGGNSRRLPPRAAKATSTTTLPLASLPTPPPRRSVTHAAAEHSGMGMSMGGIVDNDHGSSGYSDENLNDNDSGEPLYRPRTTTPPTTTTTTATATTRPRHYSGSTTASPPMTVIGAPYDDNGDSDNDDDDDDEYGIPSPPRPAAAAAAAAGGGIRLSSASSNSSHTTAAQHTPLSWRR
ncbi:hypothetical protein HDU86_002589 [Geranomyces michiganensis]|nr:hypothetical protein HDU86_002589 [Geranomyces michiganensis]